MEVRKLKPEENVQRELISSICYLGMDREDRLPWLENPMEHKDGYEHAWGYFEDNKLISSMLIAPCTINHYNTHAKTSLICGVVTLPEFRNAGCVRKIFEHTLPVMYDEGVVFSMLHPFSITYYRKFGYEVTLPRPLYKISISLLSHYPYPSGIKSYVKGEDYNDFIKVYDYFIKDKNMAKIRSDEDWEDFMKRDPHNNHEFSYIHYNGDEPDAYILYKAEEDDGDYNMEIQEIAYTTKEGLYAILGFMHGLRSEYQYFTWHLPNSIDIFSLCLTHGAQCEDGLRIYTNIMTRIVNLKESLKPILAPPGQGSITIKVTDNQIKQNNGIFTISWENDKLEVKETKNNPDMETDIETMATIVTGFLTPSMTEIRKNTQIFSKHKELEILFPKRSLYHIESF